MPDVFRTPEERFAVLRDYPFSPNYIEWEGLRIHFVDETPEQLALTLGAADFQRR